MQTDRTWRLLPTDGAKQPGCFDDDLEDEIATTDRADGGPSGFINQLPPEERSGFACQCPPSVPPGPPPGIPVRVQ